MAGTRLIVFADYVCPFCYLAEVEVARVRREGSVVVQGAALELRPAGTPLPPPDAPWMRNGWRMAVEPLARELSVVMRYPSLVTRTRKAHEAVAWSREQGAGEALHEAVYRAYWEDGRDIGRIDVLVELGRGLGLDATGLKVALDIDQLTGRVEEDRDTAASLRITGVPAYVLVRDDTAGTARVVTGLQRYDQLRAWVEGET